MDLEKYIGFKLDEIIPIIEVQKLQYNIIEVWDNKRTKMGDEKRIINIKVNNIIEIYVAYF